MMDPRDMMEGTGADIDEGAGDTADDSQEAWSEGAQQLPGLPPMIGQDGNPLIVPIVRAKDAGRYSR